MNIRGIQALLRLELRQLRRERSRILVILLLIAVPVASLSFTGTVVNIIEPTADEMVRHEIGVAEYSVGGVDQPQEFNRAVEILGSEATFQRVYRGVDEVSATGRTVSAAILGVHPSDATDLGLAQGMIVLIDGRFPTNSGEVSLSTALADELSLKIGDAVYLSYGADREIVGLIRDSENTAALHLIRTPSYVERGGQHLLLCQMARDRHSQSLSKLRDEGFLVRTEEDIRSEADGFTIGFVFVASWIGFFEAALIIGAAQAISIKRRQRELGLIASTGGSPLQVFTSMLLVTLLVATLASLIGVMVGTLVSWIANPFLDRWDNRINGPFEVSLFFLAGAGSLGIFSSLFSVAFPAWQASRLSVQEALLSFRPDRKRSQTTRIVGTVFLITSVCLLWGPSFGEAMIGRARLFLVPLAFSVGIVLISPSLLHGSQFLCRTGFPLLRLAIRETIRYRGRSSVAIVAVFAAMSISVATATITTSLQRSMDRFPSKIRDDQVLLSGPSAQDVAERLKETREGIAAAPLLAAYSNGQPLRVQRGMHPPVSGRQEWIAIGDPELLKCFAIEDGLDDFSSGAVLSLNPESSDLSSSVSKWIDKEPVTLGPFVSIPSKQLFAGPLYFLDVNSKVGASLQKGPPPNRGAVPWIVRFSRPVDDSILRLINEKPEGLAGLNIETQAPESNSLRYASVMAITLSTFLGLVVVLSTLALNFTEARQEFRVLDSIGAETNQLRWLIAMRAWYLSIIGCLLSIPSGLVMASSLLEATNFELLWTIPWLDLVLALLIVPCVVGLVAGICLRPWKGATTLHSNLGVTP